MFAFLYPFLLLFFFRSRRWHASQRISFYLNAFHELYKQHPHTTHSTKIGWLYKFLALIPRTHIIDSMTWLTHATAFYPLVLPAHTHTHINTRMIRFFLLSTLKLNENWLPFPCNNQKHDEMRNFLDKLIYIFFTGYMYWHTSNMQVH